ncbi:MAG: hypothetical protein VX438_07190, partial [Planctomycetota bacterium]|nr:hypothetical protein [Planctomycetota bacterium]
MNSSSELERLYQEFNNGNGFFVDQDACVICLTGRDCRNFLNSFCTADLQNLQLGKLTEAFLLDSKGKTLAFALVLATQSGLNMIVPKAQSEMLANHLSKYLIVEDVLIQTLDNAFVVYFSWQTPESVPTHIGPNIFLSVFTDSIPVELIRDKVELVKTVFEMIRVENKFPKSGIDILPSNLPQEFERNQTAISFNKGCYLGQETVARLDALGHTNRSFCLITIDCPKNSTPQNELTH